MPVTTSTTKLYIQPLTFAILWGVMYVLELLYYRENYCVYSLIGHLSIYRLKKKIFLAGHDSVDSTQEAEEGRS